MVRLPGLGDTDWRLEPAAVTGLAGSHWSDPLFPSLPLSQALAEQTAQGSFLKNGMKTVQKVDRKESSPPILTGRQEKSISGVGKMAYTMKC